MMSGHESMKNRLKNMMTQDKSVFNWSKLKFGEDIESDFANGLHMVQIAGRKHQWNEWRTLKELLDGLLDMGWSKETIGDICLRHNVSASAVAMMLGYDVKETVLKGRPGWIRNAVMSTEIITQ